MRFAWRVKPRNYLLFGCHLVNFSAQSTQAYRYINHWHLGGREKALEQKAKEGLNSAQDSLEGAATAVKDAAKDISSKAKAQVDKVTK